MSDFLTQAGQIAGALRFALSSASAETGAVGALAIRPLAIAAAKLEADLLALLAAKSRDDEGQRVGFLYADDREILERDGRAFIYAEPQTFTVTTDPGCVPVFARETP